jgi:hypothetical protein
METDINRKPFQRTSNAGLLIAFLTPIAVNEDYRTITYAELSEAGHVPDIRKQIHYFETARKFILANHGKWILVVHGVGVKLATDEQAAAVARTARIRIRRAARLGRRRSGAANLEKLTNAQRLALLADNAVLGLLEHSTREIVAKRLEATFEKSGPKSFEAQELLRLGGVT